jgi:hydrogenase 3 maturation protease
VIDLAFLKNQRIAVLGVGSEWHGDDIAGVLALRALSGMFQPLPVDWLLIEAGSAPENFTGLVRRFKPDVVILIDAADMGCIPGSIRLVDWKETQGWSGSTHRMPLSTLANFIMLDLHCPVFLIGIQIRSNADGSRVSPEIEQAVKKIVEIFKRVRDDGVNLESRSS